MATAPAGERSAALAAAVQANARDRYRESVEAEMPLSGKALGEMFGKGDRWGRQRIAECRSNAAGTGWNAAAPERHSARHEQAAPGGSLSAVGGHSGAASSAAADRHSGGTVQVSGVVNAAPVPDGTGWNAAAVPAGKRYAVVALLTGIGVSIAGNVMSAREASAMPAAWVVAAFWPIAVYLAIEVITRVGWPRGAWPAVARFAGAGTVGLVAAIVSYRHMARLLTSWGEDGVSVVLGPLAVDGLVVVAATALYVINRNREASE